MAHRIREAMRTGSLAPMGGLGKAVEVDETFIGNKKGKPKKRGYAHKMAALSLVERGGQVRSFQIDKANTENIKPIVRLIAPNIVLPSLCQADAPVLS